LKYQLLISTILLIPTLALAAWITLPDRLVNLTYTERTPWAAFICTIFGLIAGLIIGIVTEYYTSHQWSPVREVAKSCETGPATNIIYGTALGNWSVIIPIIVLAIVAYCA